MTRVVRVTIGMRIYYSNIMCASRTGCDTLIQHISGGSSRHNILAVFCIIEPKSISTVFQIFPIENHKRLFALANKITYSFF